MKFSSKRFLFGIPLVAAVLVGLLGWWTDRAVRDTIESTVHAALKAGLEANVTALDIWINTQTRLAAVVTDDPDFQSSVADLLERPAEPTREWRRAEPSAAAQTVQRQLDQRIRSSGFAAAVVIGTNLQIVATSGRARMRLGSPVETEHAARVLEVLANGRPVLVTPFKAGFGRPRGPGGPGGRGGPGGTGGRGRFGDSPPPPGALVGANRPAAPSRDDFNLMEILAPVRDSSGRVIAAVGFILRPDEEFTKVLSVARPGDTGETFAFDAAGRLVSESRFNEQLVRLGMLTNTPGIGSSLNIELRDPGFDLTAGPAVAAAGGTNRPLIGMVARAIGGESGVTLVPERDYRGIPVIGASQWLPERNFGVAIKLDAAEAFHPLEALRSIFAVLVGLLLLGTLVTLAASYGNLVWRRRFNDARLKALRLGQYTLAERIGEGGMGVVYRAHHAMLRRETAIKLLLPGRSDPSLVRQFEREVRMTCNLSHPNTIQIYDYGHTADGIFYYAMELLRGMTLHELVERHGPQPEERAIHFLVQICGSLREAHAHGLIHRDIKPGNLFLCERGGEPDTVKVLDFGLVRHFGDGNARERAVHVEGTPLYMAPETLEDPEAGDPRSDLYAVGAVAYFLVTGGAVFEGDTTADVLERRRAAPPAPLRERVSRPVTPEFEAVVTRCLEKDPARRPQSAEDLLNILALCPKAGDWTAARRGAWWRHHVDAIRPADPGRGGAPTTPVDRTVKIDFGNR